MNEIAYCFTSTALVMSQVMRQRDKAWLVLGAFWIYFAAPRWKLQKCNQIELRERQFSASHLSSQSYMTVLPVLSMLLCASCGSLVLIGIFVFVGFVFPLMHYIHLFVKQSMEQVALWCLVCLSDYFIDAVCPHVLGSFNLAHMRVHLISPPMLMAIFRQSIVNNYSNWWDIEYPSGLFSIAHLSGRQNKITCI